MAIETRIFLGFILSKEIEMHLNRSALWKEDKILGSSQLSESIFQEKKYIGVFVPSFLTCVEIQKKEEAIREQLQLYCPKLNLDRHGAYLFPQLFFA